MNVCFELSAMNAALFAVMRLIELEQPELDRSLCECRVEVQHVVTAVVVVCVPAVIGAISLIPDVRKLSHGGGFRGVKATQKFGVYCPAIAFSS